MSASYKQTTIDILFIICATYTNNYQKWNGLSNDVTTSLTLPVFRKRLETHLFRQSYPDIFR